MKKLLFIFLISLVLFACSDDDNNTTKPENQTYESFDEIEIPEDFDFQTSNNVTLELWAPVKATVVVTDDDNNEYFRTLTNDTGYIEKGLSIPTHVENLNFAYRNMEFSYPINVSDERLIVELYRIHEDEEKTRTSKKPKNYIVPILEGIVLENDGSITSHWGYDNQNSSVETVPIGSKNKFTGSGLNSSNQDQGQPTTFQPGRHYNVFTVNFTSIGNDCITWSLHSKNRLTQDACPDAPLLAGADSDNDGVEDDNDAYPDDENKAYDVYYPSANTLGTLAFEDLWPRLGDYDFNDLVIRYRVKEIQNAQNEVVAVEMDYKLVAIGANFRNGFFVELPFNVNDVTLNSAPAELASEVISYGDLAILKVFNNTNDVVQYSTNFMNTDPAEGEIAPVEFTISLDLATAYAAEDMIYLAPYNPFITINSGNTGDTSKEVHLPGFPPTSNADASLFGTEDDNTNPAGEVFYKTSEGIPWAMNIVAPVKHPIEHIDIVNAYPYFGSWVASNGLLNVDWYNNPETDKVITISSEQ